MTAVYGQPGTEEPTVVELEAAITLHGSQCHRYGRFWREYEWTHEQINLLLDQRDHALNALAAEAVVLSAKRKASLERWWRGVGA